MDVEVIGCPIVIEEDGLAMSSRNTYLNPEERKASGILSDALELGKKLYNEGNNDAEAVTKAMSELIEREPLAHIDYVSAVNAFTMMPAEKLSADVLFALAVYIGKTRLIDNLRLA